MSNSIATSVTQTIVNVIASIVPSVPYCAEWENGTGYFDGAVNEKICEVGATVSSVTSAGRAILIHATAYGNVIIFNRHTNSGNVVMNTNRALQGIVKLITHGNTLLSDESVSSIVGYERGFSGHPGTINNYSTLAKTLENLTA